MKELLETITWLLEEGFEIKKDEYGELMFEFWGETKGLENWHTIEEIQEIDGVLHCRVAASVRTSDYYKDFVLRCVPFTIDSVKRCLKEI